MITTPSRTCVAAALFCFLVAGPQARAQSQQQFADDATRVMALGDSIAAGYKAMPVTSGYAYLLYQGGVFDRIPHTLFCNAAVPGASSRDVLLHQVPQALIVPVNGGFSPHYITLTVGGNDLLAILHFAATHPDQSQVLQFAQQVLGDYARNLGQSLAQLRAGLPQAKIFVANQYAIPEIQAILPFTDLVVDSFNAVVAQVVAQFPNVFLVDAHEAFLDRSSLLLVERPGSSPFEVHLTSAGHRAMAQAFKDVVDQNR